MKQMSLFDDREAYNPLASRLRPDDLDGFVGQEHLLGKGKLLCQLIEQDKIPSMIFWGPPGVGKAILAGVIVKRTNAQFINLSAITNGIKEIKEVMVQAENNWRMGIRALLLMDEVHRFNGAQQDAFLPHVEKGSTILTGAIMENPFFEVNSALLSWCRAFVLQVLTENDLAHFIRNALRSPKGLGYLNVEITNHMVKVIAEFADGDTRTILSTLEMAVTNGVISPDKTTVTKGALKQCIREKSLLYDEKGEKHYNLIFTLHRSMCNSDPGVAAYWLAHMLEAGEDPLYVARRPVRLASKDIGMANSQALTLTVSAYQACRFLGMPKCNVHLSHAAIHLSITPKSNSTYMAYESAKANAQNMLTEPVPLTIRNTPAGLMKDLRCGSGYVHAHDTKEKVARAQCLPDSLGGREYYRPADQGAEEPVKSRLEEIRKRGRGK